MGIGLISRISGLAWAVPRCFGVMLAGSGFWPALVCGALRRSAARGFWAGLGAMIAQRGPVDREFIVLPLAPLDSGVLGLSGAGLFGAAVQWAAAMNSGAAWAFSGHWMSDFVVTLLLPVAPVRSGAWLPIRHPEPVWFLACFRVAPATRERQNRGSTGNRFGCFAALRSSLAVALIVLDTGFLRQVKQLPRGLGRKCLAPWGFWRTKKPRSPNGWTARLTVGLVVF